MSANSRGGPTQFGGFWRRTAALLLDNFLYSAVSLPLLLAVFGPAYLQGVTVAELAQMEPPMIALRIFFAGLPYALILVLWVTLGATPGKLLMECRIVDARSGERPGARQALLRLLGYLVSGPLTLGIGFLWVIWDKRKQGLHDKLAGTVVRLEQEDYFYRSQPSMEQLACRHLAQS